MSLKLKKKIKKITPGKDKVQLAECCVMYIVLLII